MWRRQAAAEFALTVVYKSKPTHHMIKRNGDGYFTLGKLQPVKECTELKPMIEALQQPVKGWPIPLSNPVVYQPPTADAPPVGSTPSEIARRSSAIVRDLAAVNPGDDSAVPPAQKDRRSTMASIDASLFDGDHNSPAADTHKSAPSPGAPSSPGDAHVPREESSTETIDDPLNSSTYSVTVTEAPGSPAAVTRREKKPSAAGEGEDAVPPLRKRRSITSAETGHKIGITNSAYGRIEDNRLADLSQEMQDLASKLKKMFASADTAGGGYKVVDGIQRAQADGLLNAAEMKFRFDLKEMHSMVVAAGILPFFDEDHDGKVEYHELMAKLDINGDGMISMTEFIDGWRRALTATEQEASKEHSSLMHEVANQHGVVPHSHAIGLSARLVPPAGPTPAELALAELAKVSAEAAQRLEERRQMALRLQAERLTLEQQARRYNAMVGSRNAGVRAYEENPAFSHGKKKRGGGGPRPRSQAFPVQLPAGYPSSGRDVFRGGSTRAKQADPRQFGAHAAPSMDLWTDSRRAAFERLRGKIKTSGQDQVAPGDSSAEEVGKPGMFVTFGGFCEKDGHDVVDELTV